MTAILAIISPILQNIQVTLADEEDDVVSTFLSIPGEFLPSFLSSASTQSEVLYKPRVYKDPRDKYLLP